MLHAALVGLVAGVVSVLFFGALELVEELFFYACRDVESGGVPARDDPDRRWHRGCSRRQQEQNR